MDALQWNNNFIKLPSNHQQIYTHNLNLKWPSWLLAPTRCCLWIGTRNCCASPFALTYLIVKYFSPAFRTYWWRCCLTTRYHATKWLWVMDDLEEKSVLVLFRIYCWGLNCYRVINIVEAALMGKWRFIDQYEIKCGQRLLQMKFRLNNFSRAWQHSMC